MNAKTVFSAALILTAVSFSVVRGQTPGDKNAMDAVPPAGVGTHSVDGVPGPLPGQNLHLSSWINGDKYQCCGAVGASGPVQTELFFRVGPSIVAGNGTIADVLQTGLYTGVGGRSIFFEPSLTEAWAVELGVANISNHAHSPSNYPGIPLKILVPANDPTGQTPPQPVSFGKNGAPGVTLRNLNRTFFDLGVGREWYVWGSAAPGCSNWRFGFDGGGRWGSESAEFNEIRHRVDVIGGTWAAFHTDFEFPCCGCCILQAGFRVEYGYTWSDILQIQNKSDVQDVNILFNLGLRF